MAVVGVLEHLLHHRHVHLHLAVVVQREPDVAVEALELLARYATQLRLLLRLVRGAE